MPNEMTRLLATVSALGLSLGVAFDATHAAPEPGVVVAPEAVSKGTHIKKATLDVRKSGAETSRHHKGWIEVQSSSMGNSKPDTIGGAKTETVNDTPPK